MRRTIGVTMTIAPAQNVIAMHKISVAGFAKPAFYEG